MRGDWLQRWQAGRIGWHEAQGNSSLKRYWQAGGRHVLVPLCGKSYDMIWLESQGNEVLGVELSEIAAHAFFVEQSIPFTVVDDVRFEANDRNLTIVYGDYFEYRPDELFDALYDRGALVALPAELRGHYAKHTSSLLQPDALKFVITVEYDQNVAAGPPFSVSAAEVKKYWPELECVDRYDDIENCPPKFKKAGLAEMFEVVWRSGATRALV